MKETELNDILVLAAQPEAWAALVTLIVVAVALGECRRLVIDAALWSLAVVGLWGLACCALH